MSQRCNYLGGDFTMLMSASCHSLLISTVWLSLDLAFKFHKDMQERKTGTDILLLKMRKESKYFDHADSNK